MQDNSAGLNNARYRFARFRDYPVRRGDENDRGLCGRPYRVFRWLSRSDKGSGLFRRSSGAGCNRRYDIPRFFQKKTN
jgi:hypothetical protein